MAFSAATSADAGPVLAWPSAPMLCKSIDHLPAPAGTRSSMSYEPKFDGFRGLLGVGFSDGVQIRSRQGTDLTGAFPDIATAAAGQLPPGTVVDGELVVWLDGRLDFSQLQRRLAAPARASALARRAPASYVLFDVLQYEGRVLGGEPQRVRRRLLESILPSLTPPLQVVPSTRDREVAAHWFADYAAADVGIEGLVLKNPAGRYVEGRRGWLKVRSRSSTEAVVAAVTGPLVSPERLILGSPDDEGVLRVVGSTVPLSPAQRLAVGALLRPFTGTHPWPADVAARAGTVWGSRRPQPVARVEPALVVEIDADTSVTTAGRYRHLVRLVRARPDLDPADLTGPAVA